MKIIRYLAGKLKLEVWMRKLSRAQFDKAISFLVKLAWELPLNDSELEEMHGRLARLEFDADEFLDGKQKPRQALAQRGFCRRSGLPPEMVVKSSRSHYNPFTL